jgi:TatD family-associated radical SAM protein
MEYAYTYGDARRLYLNVTNRCTNQCSFCVRNYRKGLGGAILWGGREPDFSQLRDFVLARNSFSEVSEFIWCGYGEPTFRLDLIAESASWLRSNGAKIRLNTNGHGCLIHGRDILPELSNCVDEVSISMNAPDSFKYKELCNPGFGPSPVPPEAFWESMLDFLSRAPAFFASVQASVVGIGLTEEEVDGSRKLALSFGIERFRVR